MTKFELADIAEAVKAGRMKDRKPTTLYLSRKVFEGFRRECEGVDVSASLVLEKFMTSFIPTTPVKGRKSA